MTKGVASISGSPSLSNVSIVNRDLQASLNNIDVPITASQLSELNCSQRSDVSHRSSCRKLTAATKRRKYKVLSQCSQQRLAVSPQLRILLHRISQSETVNVVSAINRHCHLSSQGSSQQIATNNNVLEDQRRLIVNIPRLPMIDNTVSVSTTGRPGVDPNINVSVHSPTVLIPNVASQLVNANIAGNINEAVNGNVMLEQVEPPRRTYGDNIARKRTWKQAVNATHANLEQMCRAPFSLGNLIERCIRCEAKFFANEFPKVFGSRRICCKNGDVALPQLTATPQELIDLFTGQGDVCNQFREKIRYINGLFAMASFKTSIPGGDTLFNTGRCFAITGQIYHYFNGVPDSQDLAAPRLNHYYFLDVADAMAHRTAFTDNAGVDINLLNLIENILRRVNPYMQAYRTMGEQLEEMRRSRRQRGAPVDHVYVGFVDDMNRLRRNFNLPESRSDIAAIFVGAEPPFPVDLILHPKTDGVAGVRHHKIDNLNKLADPMVYPLLFPGGDLGRSLDVRTVYSQKVVTCRQYYRFRLQIRDGFSIIHYGQKLYQQYIVDAWCKAEADTLWFIRQHQQKFRLAAEESVARYNRRRAAMVADEGAGGIHFLLDNNDVDPNFARVGRPVILPISFQGGERNLERRYSEAMAVIARFGKPDLLITFTCNPTWPEISQNLQPQQVWHNRPDLVCRVFSAKLKEFINDIVQKQLCGVVLNFHYVIEFQKRGLPHAHILVTFRHDDKIMDDGDVDGIVSAYIPDSTTQPELYLRVGRHQVHDQCAIRPTDATCIVDGKCRFNFPKNFAPYTIINRGSNSRPIYKRPRDGRTVHLMNRNLVIDNTRIVPYNPYFLAKYNCHLNFEVVGSIKTMKYLHKYLVKGVDSIRIDVENETRNELDEVQRYLDCRYVTSVEAFWRLFEFKMHDRSHGVTLLPVHLPGFRDIMFDEHDDIEQLQAALNKPSKLEAFFSLNANDPAARDLLYVQIPEYYSWRCRDATWVPRQMVSKMIGTVYEVSPNDTQIEKFYLRILLLHVRGPISFDDLLMVDGELCPDYKTACDRRNLLRNGLEYDRCMAEASLRKMPCRLRRLFATICAVMTEEDLAQVPRLWHKYKLYLIEDYLHRGLNYGDSINRCLEVVQQILARCKPGLTLVALGIAFDDDDVRRIQAEATAAANVEVEDLDRENNEGGNQFHYNLNGLNIEQKTIFVKIIHAIKFLMRTGPLPLDTYEALEDVSADVLGDHRIIASNMFYLDGPGGTGKTYLYNTLLHYVNNVLKLPTIAVAWTGIAANLLIGGQTVHRAFRLPLALDVNSTAGWPLEHPATRHLRNAALIVWDEAPMSPRYAIEAVDRYFKDLMENYNIPFGSKCFVFGGDFRQILPVVRATGGAGRALTLDTSLKMCHLWPRVTQLGLTINMRSRNDAQTAIDADPNFIDEPKIFGCPFTEWLLKLGDGTLPYGDFSDVSHCPTNLIEIPAPLMVASLEALINFVYDSPRALIDGYRAILCPTNSSVNEVNEIILARLPGQVTSYFARDNYHEAPEDHFHVPMEVVNAVSIPSLPPYELKLKVGAVVMLLRNMDVAAGQCNGTRMKVVSLAEHFVECEILTGTSKGRIAWIPKIKMVVKETMLPQAIERHQFPIRLAFCVTINKAQGQTLTRVGIYLKTPCFAHGQLYVAFSRVGRPQNLRCYMECTKRQGGIRPRWTKRFTSNVIYYEVFNNVGIVTRRRFEDNDANNDQIAVDETAVNVVGAPDDAVMPILHSQPVGHPIINLRQVSQRGNPESDSLDCLIHHWDQTQSPTPFPQPSTKRHTVRKHIAFLTPSPTRRPYTDTFDDLDDDNDDYLVRLGSAYIPPLTDFELRRRVAVGERAGTSRMYDDFAANVNEAT